jgi:hypothetical protein
VGGAALAAIVAAQPPSATLAAMTMLAQTGFASDRFMSLLPGSDLSHRRWLSTVAVGDQLSPRSSKLRRN